MYFGGKHTWVSVLLCLVLAGKFVAGYIICLEKEMATHSNILAWEIPWTEEPDGLQSMGSHKAKQSWAGTYAGSYKSQLGSWALATPVANIPCGVWHSESLSRLDGLCLSTPSDCPLLFLLVQRAQDRGGALTFSLDPFSVREHQMTWHMECLSEHSHSDNWKIRINLNWAPFTMGVLCWISATLQ